MFAWPCHRRWIVTLAALLVAMSLAPHAAAQFTDPGPYGHLVWDPEKNCWVRIDRDGFPRRLVDGDVKRIITGDQRDILFADGMPFTVLVDRIPPGAVAIVDGLPRTPHFAGTMDQAAAQRAFDQAVRNGQVPANGPDGRPLSPGAKQFLTDTFAPGGYGDVAAGEYGDATGDDDPWESDDSGIVSSVYVKGIGSIEMSGDGNVLVRHDLAAHRDYRGVTEWIGIGATTYYPVKSGDAGQGPVSEIRYRMDPSTDRVTSVVVTFNNGDVYTLTPGSGVGNYIDPYPLPDAGSPGGQPLVMKADPANPKKPWDRPQRKDPPKPKKDGDDAASQPTAVPGLNPPPTEPDFGFGVRWEMKLLNEPNFDFEPIDEDEPVGVRPRLQLSFLGPPPMTDVEQQQLNSLTEQIDDLGDDINTRRRNIETQRQLIAGQQEIFDLFHERTVSGVDAAREKAKDVIKGQIEAAIGVLLANSDKIKDRYDKLPDGPAKRQLGRLLESDAWDVMIAGGKDSAASHLFKQYQKAGNTYLDNLGGAALEVLPDKAQQAIGQIKAAHQLSQAVSGLVEGVWNVEQLEDLGEQIGLNQQHFVNYIRETRDVAQQQQALINQAVDLTEQAVSGANGMDRVRLINGVIHQLQSTSGDIDVSDQVDRLRTLRDETIIYLPGGAWGTEPVLYSRLYKVANAAARIQMLRDMEMAEQYPELYEAMQREKAKQYLVQIGGAGTGKTGGKEVADAGKEATTPAPKQTSDDTPPGTTIPLPDGSTGTLPEGGGGPLQLPDGTDVVNYRPGGAIANVVILPPGENGGRVVVTKHASGLTEVAQSDGTRVFTDGEGNRKVILPDGTVVVIQPNGERIVETGNKRVRINADQQAVPDTPFDLNQTKIMLESNLLAN